VPSLPVRRSRLSAWTPALAWLLVVCWALIILTLAMQPGELEVGRGRLRLDPTAAGYVAYFAGLAFLLIHALRRHAARRPGWWAISLSLCFGILVELLQIGVPGRTTSIVDLGANLVGASVGAVSFSLLARRHVELQSSGRRRTARRGRPIAVHAVLERDGR
jgi:VanZ family protein